jgi:K+/H+ antiporter YhaU regulatory subunit KhtT
LAGETIGASKISDITGLSVIGIQQNGRILTHPTLTTTLTEGSELIMMGSTRGRQEFFKSFWE